MALTFVGSGSDSGGDSDNPTLALPQGITTGDVVYVAVATLRTIDVTVAMVTSGYTKLADLYQNDTDDINLGVFRKVMGAIPDTVAIVDADNLVSCSAVFHCWRGCHTTSPEDAATVTTGGIDGGTPDPASITTVTPGAVVLAIGGSTELDVVTNPPTNYGNLVAIQTGGNVMIASRTIASPGAEDPGAYTDIVGQVTDSWAAVTVAIRPAVTGSPTTPDRGNAGAFLASWEKLRPRKRDHELQRSRGEFEVYVRAEELIALVAARHLDSDTDTMIADAMKEFESHYMRWDLEYVGDLIDERDRLVREREERKRKELEGRSGWLERRKKQERNKKT